MKNLNLSFFEKILYFIFFPLVSFGSILSPLTNDVRIFYGVEYLCWKYITPFPSNINYFFEIKPIFSHILSYMLVVVTNFFIPFSDHFAQEIFIKSIAVALAIFACWIFSKNVLKIKYGFLLCFFGIFCGLNLNILQAEWWATIFAMVACALFMEENTDWSYIAGALLIWVLLVKGTTGALIITTVCVVMIFRQRICICKGLVGFVAMGLTFFFASQTFWQTMLSDIYMAPLLSHVGEYHMLGQVYVTLVAMTISMSIYIPVIGLGLVYGLAWLNNHRKDPRALWFVGAWVAPLIIVWIQSESFGYQYFIFIIPAIVSLVLYEKDTPRERLNKKLKRENLVAATIVILFVLYCILYSPISKYGSEEKAMNDYFNNESEKINKQFGLENQSVLYLDTGSGPYYFGANSSCRYVAPLVIQRANPGRTIIQDLPQYNEAVDCVLTYHGEYIVADGPLGVSDGWFGMDTVEKRKIVEKIKNEYTSVHSGGWEIYKKNKN